MRPPFGGFFCVFFCAFIGACRRAFPLCLSIFVLGFLERQVHHLPRLDACKIARHINSAACAKFRVANGRLFILREFTSRSFSLLLSQTTPQRIFPVGDFVAGEGKMWRLQAAARHRKVSTLFLDFLVYRTFIN